VTDHSQHKLANGEWRVVRLLQWSG
jgi:hypothetical protein